MFRFVIGFWDMGHKLFKTTPESYPAKFLAGDSFDDAHLSLTAPAPPSPPPSLATVKTLTELRGHISVIHASSFFHLFGEEKQFELAKRIGSLLDSRPGSIIFGSHGTMPVKGQRVGMFRQAFCHSPDSWTELWEEQIFEKGQVKVTTYLLEMDTAAEGLDLELTLEKKKIHWLFWSVERL